MGKLLLLLLRWKTVVDHHCSFCFHFSTGEEEENEEEEEEQEEDEEERQNGGGNGYHQCGCTFWKFSD